MVVRSWKIGLPLQQLKAPGASVRSCKPRLNVMRHRVASYITGTLHLMPQKVIGVCELCREERELQDSHLIPAWAYRRIRESNKEQAGSIINVTTRGAFQTDKQYRKHLLCKSCEQRFGNIEGRVAKLTRHGARRGEIALHSKIKSILYHDSCQACTFTDEQDGEDLAYFAASVIWRTYPIVGTCDLGAYEPEFRDFLLGRKPFPDNAAIVAGIYDISPTTDMRGWMSVPTSGRMDGKKLHGFIFLGLNFRCWVGKNIPQRNISHSITNKGSTKLIISMPPEKSGDFKDIFEFATSVIPRGKIRRRRPGD